MASRSASVRRREAIDAGIGYMTEDRKGKGLLLQEKLAPNLTLSALGRFHQRPISMRKRREVAGARAGDRANTISALKSRMCRRASFRGGNQQKLLLAKIC